MVIVMMLVQVSEIKWCLFLQRLLMTYTWAYMLTCLLHIAMETLLALWRAVKPGCKKKFEVCFPIIRRIERNRANVAPKMLYSNNSKYVACLSTYLFVIIIIFKIGLCLTILMTPGLHWPKVLMTKFGSHRAFLTKLDDLWLTWDDPCMTFEPPAMCSALFRLC